MSAPVLSLPDYTKEFLVYTDASFIGLGAALHQRREIDGKLQEVAICFISRTLRGAEMRYAATQLECLAVVWALEKLHYYLDGSTFEVITDCAAVKSLLGMRTPNRHMFRWQLAIQEYRGRMTISHRAGSMNQNADILSRCPLPNDSSNPAAVPEEDHVEILGLHMIDLESEFYDLIRESYVKDENLVKITKILSHLDAVDTETLISSLDEDYKKLVRDGCFILEDDLLYFQKKSSHRIVIGPNLKVMVLRMCHDEILSGHFSYEKTLVRVRNTAWWLHYIKLLGLMG